MRPEELLERESDLLRENAELRSEARYWKRMFLFVAGSVLASVIVMGLSFAPR